MRKKDLEKDISKLRDIIYGENSNYICTHIVVPGFISKKDTSIPNVEIIKRENSNLSEIHLYLKNDLMDYMQKLKDEKLKELKNELSTK